MYSISLIQLTFSPSFVVTVTVFVVLNELGLKNVSVSVESLMIKFAPSYVRPMRKR